MSGNKGNRTASEFALLWKPSKKLIDPYEKTLERLRNWKQLLPLCEGVQGGTEKKEFLSSPVQEGAKSITGQLATRGLISGKMKPESVQNE